jgi:hypothetical protein
MGAQVGRLRGIVVEIQSGGVTSSNVMLRRPY